jgi:predicted DsbA family dithiol-disulfide isomerase
MESPRVRADVIEVQESPRLSKAYAVRGVPKTVINDSVEFVGAVPEEAFLAHVLRAIGEEDSGHTDADVGDSTPIA